MEKAQNFYDKITDWLKKNGFEDIKANAEGFDTPKTFVEKSSDKIITPDITAVDYQSKYYIEIAMKPTGKDGIRDLVSKWKLLSMMAMHKGGQLYLFVPRGHKSFTQEILERYKIDAKYLNLSKLSL